MSKLSYEPKRLVSTHCLNLSIVRSQQCFVEQELLLGRLNIKTGYHQASPMYGGHPRISPQTNHSLGADGIKADRRENTGSTADLAPGKRRWHIRSAQVFTIKRCLLERFSAGGMTRN
jgi:hypothetical protein